MSHESKIKKSEIFEKVVHDKTGRIFRVQFVVVERNGVLRGKVISCQEIKGLRGCTGKRPSCGHILLAGTATRKSARISKRGYRPILSPFSQFDFLTEIKIRAPSSEL